VIVRLLSLALVAAVLFHSFNGIRIVLIDFWKKGVRYQQVMFIAALVLTVVVFLPFAYVILIPKLGGVALWFVQPVANLVHP
jgi:succinate dehydrogenase / fumarate reductase cytochrome b subunit